MNKLQKQAWYCISVLSIFAIVYLIAGFIFGFSLLLFLEISILPATVIAFGAARYKYDSIKHGSITLASIAIEDERDLDIVTTALTYALTTAWLSFYLFMEIEYVFSIHSSHNIPENNLLTHLILSGFVFVLVYSIIIALNKNFVRRARAEKTNKKTRFENKIFLLRFQNGEMTRQQLAESVGVTHKTIVDIESGEYIPSAILAMRIAGVFGVTVEQAFELDEPEKVDARKLEELYRPFDNPKPNSDPPVSS